MAIIVYGRNVRESAAEVAYTFGDDPNEASGVVVIPLDDVEAWYVEGVERGREPFGAKRVAGKAYAMHSRTGAWPEDGSYYA